MNHLNSTTGISLATLMTLATSAHALPPIWETQTGSALSELDDASESERVRVALPFTFQFNDVPYDSIWVHVGGVISLGGEQELPSAPDDGDVGDLQFPAIAPFWSDIETNEGGSVRYNAIDDKVVITWDGVRADSAEDTAYTFQTQLYDDGSIVFGYADTLAIGDDFLNADLIVGVSNGGPGSDRNFSNEIPFQTSESSVYEFFPENSFVFTLNNQNLVFTPIPGGGFEVGEELNTQGCPADFADPFGELDFFDASAFISAFNAQDPSADFNADGMYDFFDVSAFLTAFNDGCP